MEAEYMAVIEALEAASHIRRNDRFLMLYTDCEPLIRKIAPQAKYSVECNGKWREKREAFQKAAAPFNWRMNWIPREHNTDANDLARGELRKAIAS